jgi:hypothetical protein
MERSGCRWVADCAERLGRGSAEEPVACIQATNEGRYRSLVAELSQLLGGPETGDPVRVGKQSEKRVVISSLACPPRFVHRIRA